jgi:hypothetical protein
MKHQSVLFAALVLCACVVLPSRVRAIPSQEQGAGAEKLQKLSQVLNLSPAQKSQLEPILEAEAPKVKAIKDNPSLSGREKMKQLKAVHEQADPQVKAILNPTQYKQWEDIRKDEMEEMKKSAGH